MTETEVGQRSTRGFAQRGIEALRILAQPIRRFGIATPAKLDPKIQRDDRVTLGEGAGVEIVLAVHSAT